MKRYFCLILFLTNSYLYAQYGFEWINFNQEYVKIVVAKDDVYRVTYEDLVALGNNFTGIDPRRLRLFYHGQEVAIEVEGENDAIFNAGDYIQFFGKANDGLSDAPLYIDQQPSYASPIYSDSSAYFLTWSFSGDFGKRISGYQRNNVDGITAEAFSIKDTLIYFTDNYHGGRIYPEAGSEPATRYSWVDSGEGWTGPRITKRSNQNSVSFNVALNGLTYRNGTGFQSGLNLLFTGRNNLPHVFDVLAGRNGNELRTLASESFSFQNWLSASYTLSDTDFENGSTTLSVNLIGTSPTSNDAISISSIYMNYPSGFTFNYNSAFSLTSKNGGDAFIQYSTPPEFRLWDVSNPEEPVEIRRIPGVFNSIIENVGLNNRYFFFGEPVRPTLKRVNFRNPVGMSPGYIIISLPELNRTVASRLPVEAYLNYRESISGGGYQTELFYMDEVYDLFFYGETNPLAIKNLCDYFIEEKGTGFFFLIGKGYIPGVRRKNGFSNSVPTFGTPGSDLLYVLDENNNQRAAIGRLSVTSAQQVLNYLQKAQRLESQEMNSLWRKRGLHLSGGITEIELQLFASYLNGFENIAEGEYLGGKYETIFKENTNVVAPVNVVTQVNEGLNVITFFGHSGVNVIDIDIGFASDETFGYNNIGQHPLIILNGCEGGNIFVNGTTFGEDWLHVADVGAIGLIGHSYYGYPLQLRRWNELFYEFQFADTLLMDQPMGEIHRRVQNEFFSSWSGPIENAMIQQFLLQGDPAIRLFPTNLPDFAIQENGVSVGGVDGNPLNALSDSIRISLVVSNYGRTLSEEDSIGIKVTRRRLPSGNLLSQDTLYIMNTPTYQDTLEFAIFNGAANEGFGINSLEIQLDPLQLLPEISENNNAVFTEFTMPLAVTLNLYPFQLGIVDSLPVTLSWQSTNPLDDPKAYEVELDTIITFSSPFLQQTTRLSRVLGQWTPDFSTIDKQDTVTFYWRSREIGEDNWTTSSFSYYPEVSGGWAFNHNAQLIYMDNQNLTFNGIDWDFDTRSVSLQAEVDTALYGNGTSLQVRYNDEPILYPAVLSTDVCLNNSLIMTTFRKDGLVPERRLLGRLCGRRPRVFNSLNTNELIVDYLESIPDGDWVLGLTQGSVAFSSWSDSVQLVLQDIGLGNEFFNTLSDGVPVLFLGKKGSNESVFVIGDNPEEIISFSRSISEKLSSAVILSDLIGPVFSWKSARVNLLNSAQDSVFVRLLSNEGNELIRLSKNESQSLAGLVHDVAQLEIQVFDTVDRTFPGDLQVRLSFEPYPDGLLLIPDNIYSQFPDTSLIQGQVYRDSLHFINVTPYAFTDSLLFINNLGGMVDSVSFNMSDSILNIPVNIDTQNPSGIGNIGVRMITQDHQLFNNILEIQDYIKVDPDVVNAQVSVRIDGRLLLDGDIVSPEPQIEITLADNNPFILLNDTSLIDVFLKDPCEGCKFRRLSFQQLNARIDYQKNHNQLTVAFQPDKLDDGIYTLRVQSTDAAGNAAGASPYEISFEVINETTLTRLYPYPNPFSTSMRFIFTLTGSRIPDEFTIQIFTIGGRLVRQISREEFGMITIGHNVSDFDWDGRDQYGDQLANGVYLYKINASVDGEEIELRETAGDVAFKNGYGKIYLLR